MIVYGDAQVILGAQVYQGFDFGHQDYTVWAEYEPVGRSGVVTVRLGTSRRRCKQFCARFSLAWAREARRRMHPNRAARLARKGGA